MISRLILEIPLAKMAGVKKALWYGRRPRDC